MCKIYLIGHSKNKTVNNLNRPLRVDKSIPRSHMLLDENPIPGLCCFSINCWAGQPVMPPNNTAISHFLLVAFYCWRLDDITHVGSKTYRTKLEQGWKISPLKVVKGTMKATGRSVPSTSSSAVDRVCHTIDQPGSICPLA